MGWIRVDDHFNEHPKLARVGPCGWGIWVAGLAYCNRNLTDGFIPRAVARSLGDFEFALDGEVYRLAITAGMGGTDLDCTWIINLLVDARLWEEVPDGYRVHDYHDFQPSKDKVLAEREQKAARQQRWRNGKADTEVDASTSYPVDASVDGDVDALVSSAPTPTPSRDTSSLRSDVVECFAYWQERCGHPHAKLTADRRRKIEGRRKDGYTVQQIRQAIDGAARAAFVNDAGRRFDDVELICRTGSKLEGFMERATANVRPFPANGRRESPSDLLRAINGGEAS